MNKINDSKFNMWRACVGALHFDQQISAEERLWAEEKLKNLAFTPEQKSMLKRDLEMGNNFDECFAKITDKVDRAFLVNTLRVLGHLDRNFSAAEKEKFKTVEESVLNGIDFNAVIKSVEAVRTSEEANKKQSMIEKVYEAFENFSLK